VAPSWPLEWLRLSSRAKQFEQAVHCADAAEVDADLEQRGPDLPWRLVDVRLGVEGVHDLGLLRLAERARRTRTRFVPGGWGCLLASPVDRAAGHTERLARGE
jgi:hypothetical protein